MLRNAIIEQWKERFDEDESYVNKKLNDINNCQNINDLLYHCMNIDSNGHSIIAKKINMSATNFSLFISTFRMLDQSGF